MIWQEWAFAILAVLGMAVLSGWLLFVADPASSRPQQGYKEAKIAPVKGLEVLDFSIAKRSMRQESHNEWLMMWYNAPPLDRREFLERAWMQIVADYPPSWQRQYGARQKQEFLLNCVSSMVQTLTHEDTREVPVGVVHAGTAGEVLVGAGAGRGAVARREVAAGVLADACRCCACGPESSC